MAGYSGAGQATAVAPERSTQVSSQISHLDAAIEMLEREVGNMIEALSDVSRNEPPSPAKEGAKVVAEVIVPVANRIRNLTERVEVTTCAIVNARARLEV